MKDRWNISFTHLLVHHFKNNTQMLKKNQTDGKKLSKKKHLVVWWKQSNFDIIETELIFRSLLNYRSFPFFYSLEHLALKVDYFLSFKTDHFQSVTILLPQEKKMALKYRIYFRWNDHFTWKSIVFLCFKIIIIDLAADHS